MPSKLKLIHTEKLNNEKEQRKFYLDKLNRSLSRNTKVNRYSLLGKFYLVLMLLKFRKKQFS